MKLTCNRKGKMLSNEVLLLSSGIRLSISMKKPWPPVTWP